MADWVSGCNHGRDVGHVERESAMGGDAIDAAGTKQEHTCWSRSGRSRRTTWTPRCESNLGFRGRAGVQHHLLVNPRLFALLFEGALGRSRYDLRLHLDKGKRYRMRVG
jgi:hypothetical protein